MQPPSRLLDAHAVGMAPLTVASDASAPARSGIPRAETCRGGVAAGRLALHALIGELPHQAIDLLAAALRNWNST
jgi:hypothetical protein